MHFRLFCHDEKKYYTKGLSTHLKIGIGITCGNCGMDLSDMTKEMIVGGDEIGTQNQVL